ncbi:FecR family protein [Parachryseolinea silvisoli]|uniref:FecR family protein n=1 Tax=Parachryseolinea silvisoli TaxID=2873601 RepID=UPI002265AA96|nr:FecR family protein [Parachryseolinea silvisoli]MCD9018797.1 FecR domain-containing protein [Parachryseolinea silvisoli]
MSVNDPEEDVVVTLLSNKDFKDWVLNPSGDRDFYWQNWIKSNPDKLPALNKARELALQLKFNEDHLTPQEVDQLLGDIISEKTSTRAGKAVSLQRHSYTRWIKIAASLLLVLSSSVYLYRYVATAFKAEVAVKKVQTRKGQRLRIDLPDGSVAFLNAGSTLTFPEAFSDTLRSVALTGEAFFEVVKNPEKPFVVKTADIQTRVLGTSFNVRSFESDSATAVSLVTGKVRVAPEHPSSKKQEYVLAAGERLVYRQTDHTFEKATFEIADITGWKDGVLVFSDTDFAATIQRLEQWYGVEITVQHPPSKDWHVNGHFENEPLSEVLASIQFVYDIKYTIKDSNVVLTCN